MKKDPKNVNPQDCNKYIKEAVYAIEELNEFNNEDLVEIHMIFHHTALDRYFQKGLFGKISSVEMEERCMNFSQELKKLARIHLGKDLFEIIQSYTVDKQANDSLYSAYSKHICACIFNLKGNEILNITKKNFKNTVNMFKKITNFTIYKLGVEENIDDESINNSIKAYNKQINNLIKDLV